jgi:hypothetical protein
MKRNPFRKRPIADFLDWLDNFLDPDGDGRYLAIIYIIVMVLLCWLSAPYISEEQQIDRHIRYNEYTRQYYRDVTY